ncbi:MAG: putative metal-dependent hydrolase [Paracoccaceae bacterium]|jgi:predicted metal-dependent hydrolase
MRWGLSKPLVTGCARMADHFLPGVPPVPLTLRRSARARRISLRISQLDGRVTLTLPTRVPLAEALDFANSKNSWIRDHLSNRPNDVPVAHGAVLPVEGVPRRVVAAPGRRVVLRPDEIAASGAAVGPRLKSWLRALARDRLAEASDHYAGLLGRPYTRITMRDTRSRWGSCSSQGALMYSWRLILAPPEVLRYVAAHEVAHLAEMNHSAAFWDNVTRLHGPYEAPRRWLHQQGADLHRYRF